MITAGSRSKPRASIRPQQETADSAVPATAGRALSAGAATGARGARGELAEPALRFALPEPT